MSIRIEGIRKRFGTHSVLEDIDLEVHTGELVALLGPSGCGKTTLLRIIAGLEQPDAGSVHFDGTEVTGAHARKRNVGFVFQHYALFRHMTVFDNVAFGLQVQPRAIRPPKEEIRKRVQALLELVQLDWLGDRYPPQLSGGQRQRIALARALAVEPRVMLLDEPFGALDANVRKELRRWLKRLHDQLHVTSIFVTHDQDEAMEVADRIVVMNKGLIEQVGSPDEVFEHPASPFVCSFVGTVNLFHGRLDDPKAVAYVRPHELALSKAHTPEMFSEATVERIQVRGVRVTVDLRDVSTRRLIEVELSREELERLSLAIGDSLFVGPRRITLVADGGHIVSGSSK